LSYTLISPSSIDLCFFTVRQPPTSTLFPYTTLFRSQETRAELAQLSAEVVEPQGWHVRLCPALAKGRAGVALYSRREPDAVRVGDRKSTRLNSSHVSSSYAVFCLKKKRKKELKEQSK